MILGILSDNHGRLPPVRRALELFDHHHVEAIVHCGDVGGPETLELLSDRPCWFVWGNMDRPREAWRRSLASDTCQWPDSVPVVFSAGDKRLALCHGHEPVFRAVCRSGEYAYVLHGHTHQPTDRHEGTTRVINPGALHRTAQMTVAVLDVSADVLQFLRL